MESIRNFKVKDRRIILRLDLNTEISPTGEIFDLFRLERALPTIRYLLTAGAAKIIIVSHLGRPEPETAWVKNEFSLKPLAQKISELMGEEVIFIEDNLETNLESIKLKISASPGRLFVLENIRYYLAENQNDLNFAQKLASLGDCYVNDAFSVSHRQAASLCAIKKYLPSYFGLLVEEELHNLNRILNNPARPLIVIMAGAKISDKLPLMEKMLPWADKILTGGALANTLLKAKGFNIGQSLAESIDLVPDYLLKSDKLLIPQDVVVLEKDNFIKDKRIEDVLDTDNILDIGPQTLEHYFEIMKTAQSLLWNGPLGKIEDERFRKASLKTLELIFNLSAFAVLGGGETTALLNFASLDLNSKKNIFVSTGGGAMLSYLTDGELVALKD